VKICRVLKEVQVMPLFSIAVVRLGSGGTTYRTGERAPTWEINGGENTTLLTFHGFDSPRALANKDSVLM
jgi:hypothetical protein